MTIQNSYAYPMVRGSGAFLVCVGAGIVAATLWPTAAPVHISIFLASVGLGAIAIPLVRRIRPLGAPPRRHIAVMLAALLLEFIAFYLVFSKLPPATPLTDKWLWAFLIVGVHFLPMGWALGKRVVFLGLACIAFALVGLLSPGIPFEFVSVMDGILKLAFGAHLALTGIPRHP
ncbi:MAG: hypothetical protein H6978_16705 [Gammaproteobacteria bacterium]|nr:hypothetical protein [Gammaproteobacteria bacterium]